MPAAQTRHGAVGGGDYESQSVVRLQRGELEEALLAGRFQEVKWTATIALALLRTAPDEGGNGGLRA